jgi:hypothetical protein
MRSEYGSSCGEIRADVVVGAQEDVLSSRRERRRKPMIGVGKHVRPEITVRDRPLKRCAVFLLLSLLGFGSTLEAEDTWHVDTLSVDADLGLLALAVDSSGVFHLAYRSDDDDHLHYGTMDGAVWTDEVVPDSGAGAYYGGDIAVSPSGEPSVLYLVGETLHLARKSSGTWQVETVDPDHDITITTEIALASDGTPHAIYSVGWYSIWYAKRQAGSWFREQLNAQPSLESGAIAMGANDEPHALYAEYRDYMESSKLFYAVRQGSRWNTVVPDSTNDFHNDLHLVLDPLDHPHIAFTEVGFLPPDDMWYAAHYLTQTEGGVWVGGGYDGISAYDGSMGTAAIALDPEEDPHILYHKRIDATGISTLYHRWEEGGAWATETLPFGDGRADLAIASDGIICVAYTPGTGLFLARKGISTGVSAATESPRALSIVVGPNPSTGDFTIRYDRSWAKTGAVIVYDIRGRMVRILAAREATGILTWDGTDQTGSKVSTGVYFVRLSDGDRAETRRVTVLR